MLSPFPLSPNLNELAGMKSQAYQTWRHTSRMQKIQKHFTHYGYNQSTALRHLSSIVYTISPTVLSDLASIMHAIILAQWQWYTSANKERPQLCLFLLRAWDFGEPSQYPQYSSPLSFPVCPSLTYWKQTAIYAKAISIPLETCRVVHLVAGVQGEGHFTIMNRQPLSRIVDIVHEYLTTYG